MIADRILKKCKPYLKELSREPIELCLDLEHFGEVQGEKALLSMERFLTHAEKNNFDKGLIVSTLSHDLYGCDRKLFSPRTSAY